MQKERQSKISALSVYVLMFPQLYLGFLFHFRFLLHVQTLSVSSFCFWPLHRGVRILYQELVTSIFSVIWVKVSCNSYGGSFWSFCRNLFRKSWTTELSIHLFSVNTRLNAMGARNGLYTILRLRCWWKLSLNRVSQKALSVKKLVWRKSPFGQ